MSSVVSGVLQKYSNDAGRLMDILLDILAENGYISDEDITSLAAGLDMSSADVEQTVSFYHFFARKPMAKYNVYLNSSAIAVLKGREKIATAFERESGCSFGKVSEDGMISLDDCADIGMADQEPAALINGIVFPNLTAFRVKELVRDMRKGLSVDDLRSHGLGDGMNNSEYMKATVTNNIRKKGAVIFSEYQGGSALEKVKADRMSQEQLIDLVKQSGLRGRGGAGFPTAMKWDFCRKAKGEKKYIFCNADEGEPGTFKDRVILTERPRLIFDGMALAGYAVGAEEGILYVRYEYMYMKEYLESILTEMRKEKALGKDASGIKGFNFDIRIQYGAGAYVCGEESALIESAEGKRGEPRDRPPFPVEKGYLGMPTAVNNVETLCSVAKLVTNGVEWFKSLGTGQSTGTKLLSISGDVKYPGVYEVEWGFSINDILEMSGGDPAAVQAVQVGGPSGSCVGPNEFERIVSYEDIATGGAMMVIGEDHDLLQDVVLNFTEFFIDESCGSCSTCRALTVMYKKTLEKVLSGDGRRKDIDAMLSWAPIGKASRCGLGQTAMNPICTSIKNFRYLYEGHIKNANEQYEGGFDIAKAVADSCEVVGRRPNL
ncbi:MAG: NAD(P)H-dependent oxidoreductase subunit E [Spirochaetia bacterium]